MERLCGWAPPSLLTFFIGRCVPNWGPFGFIFNDWERENELVFPMCLLRTVTWGAAWQWGRGRGEGSP